MSGRPGDEQDFVTDSTVDPADFSGILAAHAQAEATERERTIRRAIAGAAVFLVHVVAIAVFIYSVHVPLVERVRTTIPEAIWILMPQKPAPPKPRVETPPLPEDELPMRVITAPITVPPIRTRPPATPAPGDLSGVGRSLACGASRYENLTPEQRAQCIRRPWDFVRRPDGTIVLAPLDKPPPPPAFTGGDLMRHEMQTAPPCPVLQNVPCLSKVLPNRDPVTNGSQQ